MRDSFDAAPGLRSTGGDAASGEMASAIYQQLRELARSRFAGESPGHTLQPTALVHEAYLRMAAGSANWQDRAHFVAAAALHMRSVLVDHARARLADKRGGGMLRVTLDERAAGVAEADFLALDEALADLQGEDPRTAKIIELTYFGGLTREEIAGVLGVSVPTVDRGLRFGRAWLKHSLAA